MPVTAIAPEWVEITPQLARDWLRDTNLHNRRLNMGHVDALARDMGAGHWRPTGNSISFGIDADGREVLLDGQHRLAAISRSGVTVLFLVVRGLPMESQAATDIGRHRTFADALNLADEKNSSILAATLRRVNLWELGAYKAQGGNVKPTRAELADTLEKHPGLRKDIEWAQPRARNMMLAPTVAAFVRWLLRETDEGEGVWFTDRMNDLHQLPHEHIVMVLHRRIIREREMRVYGPDEFVALVVKAWNYHRRGEEVGKIQMPGILTNETFPRPV